jgi:hypothetical protein
MASSTPITNIPNLATANINSAARTLTVSNGLTYLAPVSGFFYNNAVPYTALSSSPLSWTYSGNLGVGTTTPTTKLQVNGVVTATGFTGNLTGDVTGNASTATLATSATNAVRAISATYATNTITATSATYASTVYIATSSTYAVTALSATTAITAITANTVSDNAITTAKILDANVTAAKLNGAQTGTAPIYGVRAWVAFAGDRAIGSCPISASGNVSSVTKTATGHYTITFSTPMVDNAFATLVTVEGKNNTSVAHGGNVMFGSMSSVNAVRIQTWYGTSPNWSDCRTAYVMVMR